VLQTINTTVRGLQILDLIFDRLQQKRYWRLRQNPETPFGALHWWFDSLYHRNNSRKFRALFRMTPEHFRSLCYLIENHMVF